MRQLSHFNRRDIMCCALLSAYALALFNEIILGGHRLIGEDFITFYLPMKKFLYDEIWLHHSIPYWNPYIFGGMPFWAHFESTIFYPLSFLFWLLPPDRAYGYSIFLHFVLAGLFMYGLVRSLHIGRAGSFVAGAIYTCNGFVMALLYLGHMCPIWSYIWLPAVIYFLNRAILSSTPYISASIAGVLWGIQILAGAPQDAFYTFLAAMLFLACRVEIHAGWSGSLRKLLVIAFLLFTIGAGLSAMQIIPSFEFINESVRAGLDSYDMVTIASYPLQGIITALLPHFFGSYAESTLWVANVPWSIPQQNLYVGILPLILVCSISYRKRENRRIIVFAAVLSAAALLLALGRHTPVYKIAYFLPGFDRFRAPSKIIVLWVFGFAILAAQGMDDLVSEKGMTLKRTFILCGVLTFALSALGLLFWFKRSLVLRFFSPFVLPDAIPGKMTLASELIYAGFCRLLFIATVIFFFIFLLRKRSWGLRLGVPCLCVVLLLDVASVTHKSVRYDESIFSWLESTKKALDASIGKDKTLYRIASFKYGLGANIEMYMGYQTMGGFTALFPNRTYNYLSAYANDQLPRGWVSFFYGVNENRHFIDLLNVKYEISHETRTCVLRKTCLPRAFVVPSHMVVNRDEALHYLKKPEYDPTKFVLFEKGDMIPPSNRDFSASTSLSASVHFLSYRPDYMSLEVKTSEPSYLFLSEVFYPGWKASLDGLQTNIYRGNYLFRVIQLTAGNHIVTLYFDPFSIKLGIAITVFTLFLLSGLFLFHSRKIKPASRKET
jgi:hypothetical protein